MRRGAVFVQQQRPCFVCGKTGQWYYHSNLTTCSTCRKRKAADAKSERRGTVCECGSPKTQDAEACPRCKVLDGFARGGGAVISEMRVMGGTATLAALAKEMPYISRNGINQTLLRLERSGRVRVRYESGEDHDGAARYELVA